MGDLDKPAGFYGMLRHVEQQGDVVTLRLHPFEFTNDPSAKVVFQVDLQGPQFDPNSIDHFVGQEVEIECGEHGVKLIAVLEGDEISLTAHSIAFFEATYTIKDFVDQVTGLSSAFEREHREHTERCRKLESLNLLAVELRRRAVIKSAASERHAKLQLAAIKVLDRILAELKAKNE